MTKSKAKSNKAKSNKARSNKARSNKARSNKAKSNKAKSNKAKNTKCKEGTKPINVKGKLFCVGKCPHSGGPILYDPNEDDFNKSTNLDFSYLTDKFIKNGLELSTKALLKSVYPCPPSFQALKTLCSSSNLKNPSSNIVSSQFVNF